MRHSLDLSDTVVPGGFFVLNRRAIKAFHGWPAVDNDAYACLGTYRDSGSPLREALVTAIQQAKQRVFVAAFLIGDEVVIKALAEAADRLRGGVYVITNLDERSLERGMQDYQDDDLTDDFRKKQFERLTTRGVYVRGHESCHAKFAVVDDEVAIIGSANFDSRGFEWSGELDVVVRNRVEVLQLVRLFSELWHEGCVWEIPPGETYTVSQRQPSTSSLHPQPPACAPGEVIWTNGPHNRSLLNAIHQVIASARSRLTIATYSIVGMTGNRWMLIDPLQEAIGRGVRTRLFIRQRNAFPQQSRELRYLHAMGVEIFADLRNHAKAVSADGERAVVFSSNFDAQHGLDSGVEVGVYLPAATEAVATVDRYLEHAINNADAKYVVDPSQGDLDGVLAARWCSQCPLPRNMPVSCEKADWRSLQTSASAGPVLFEASEDGRTRLLAGDSEFDLVENQGVYRLRKAGSVISSAEVLRRLLESVRQNKKDEVQRGFCTSRLTLELSQ